MSWIAWALIGWVGLGAVLTVIQVGKERKPITAETAAWTVVVQSLVAFAIIAVATGH